MAEVNETVLIVDDTMVNVHISKSTLEDDGINTLVAYDGKEAIKIAKEKHPDLIVLDVMMPGLDGYQVCEILKETPETSNIPIIFLTVKGNPEDVVKGFEIGAVDYLSKPFEPSELLIRVRNQLKLFHLQHNLEELVEARTQELTGAHKELHEMHNELTFVHTKLQEAYLEMIRRLARAADYRDNETGNHILRMGKFSAILGKAAGLPYEEYRSLSHAATMHDVGKIGIPDAILLKPGKLTQEEFEVMKQHSSLGAKLLSGIQSKLLSMAAKIAVTHHEKWDGSGYPNGLSGEDIPLEGRIAGVVDVFDALISERPYKNSWTVDEAVALLISEKGKHFDPKLVDLFLENLPEILKIKEELADNKKSA